MNLKDLLDLSETIESRLNTYWNFYAVVALGISGWIFTTDAAILSDGIWYLVIALSTFFLANLTVIVIAARRLTAVEREVSILGSQSE